MFGGVVLRSVGTQTTVKRYGFSLEAVRRSGVS